MVQGDLTKIFVMLATAGRFFRAYAGAANPKEADSCSTDVGTDAVAVTPGPHLLRSQRPSPPSVYMAAFTGCPSFVPLASRALFGA